ncbi:MAG: PHP domain-containing protein, partial [Vibrio sp.]
MKIDLHSHTHFSDGRLSPEALVDRAIEFGVHVLAITDHDTTEGLSHAHAYIKSAQKPLHLIDG